MFTPKTEKITAIATINGEMLHRLNDLLSGRVVMYVDYANVRPWSTTLRWHLDIKRLKQFLDSFEQIKAVNFYNGYLEDDERSTAEISELEKCKYVVRTKPVKIMRFPIDTSSIAPDSTALLDQFVRRALLRKLDVQTVEYLNGRLTALNQSGELYIEDRKCNFDVEIGVDMLLDLERDNADTYVLWSGDSDFSDPIEKLLHAGKKVVLFGTSRRISRELNELRDKGLIVFDIKKIRDFVCWPRELTAEASLLLKKP
jgi:uncharacterized LabA/DUF88 family protein